MYMRVRVCVYMSMCVYALKRTCVFLSLVYIKSKIEIEFVPLPHVWRFGFLMGHNFYSKLNTKSLRTRRDSCSTCQYDYCMSVPVYTRLKYFRCVFRCCCYCCCEHIRSHIHQIFNLNFKYLLCIGN